MLRQVLSAGRACALVCTMVLTGAGFTPQAWAQTRSTSAPPPAAASAASAPLQGAIAGTVFEVIATTPVDLGAPDSPRASLAHFFEAVRTGRWTDASRHLVLDKVQQPRGAELARRLKAVIDDTGWIDLETFSDAHDGRTDDGLPPHLEEVARLKLDGRNESLRMLRRSDENGAYWAFAPSAVNRIEVWYAKLPDRWLRDAFVSSGLEIMLLPGPLELLWWQWFAMAALLVGAWLSGALLGRLTRRLLRMVAARISAQGVTYSSSTSLAPSCWPGAWCW